MSSYKQIRLYLYLTLVLLTHYYLLRSAVIKGFHQLLHWRCRLRRSLFILFDKIERIHSRGQQNCTFLKTKEIVKDKVMPRRFRALLKK